MSMYLEEYQEIERLARLICSSMGKDPDALWTQFVPHSDPDGGWYVESGSPPNLYWMRYWRPAAAIYADFKMRAQVLK